MMATESSHYFSPLSSSLSKPQPQNPNPVDYIGSFISLVSNYGLRYEGVLCHLNSNDKTPMSSLNVICYGKEDRNNKGFQIPPFNEVYSYIVFNTTQIKNVLVKLPTSFCYHFGCLARGGAISSKLSHPKKPPLPYILSSYTQNGAKIRHNFPLLISNEELSKPQVTTYDSDTSSVMGPVNDGLQIAWNPLALPQYFVSNYYDLWLNHVYQSIPCDALYQDPTNAAPSSIASELVFAPQIFFTTFPPLPPVNGGFDFKALTKNFKPYELWGPQGDNNQGDQTAYTVDGSSYQNESQGNNNQEDQTAYTIDGSFYKISRNPFDPIGRPCNPVFGPIERLFPHLPSSYELADLGFV